ncbi:hypothetical protein X773_13020 [Mesorhizobium sp. LSJC285A00]|uniref:PIN-like domain-containing protein n=1 Tax=Mesorhizobium sp. LSJC285A00 TaxID=1287338 RepID=UPI0003CE16F0|nr:PIN-like domain-containing protein [Mesorhizobium sp. LSJC285A00]ESW82297.1 hypothetical protein X773_13020 [Mesorhizobium sp. LSJC285A00]
MLISLQLESAEEFLTRVTSAIGHAQSHIYVDTSFAMWLTVIGPASRAAFIDWSSTVEGRVHIPAWTIQEYYRHHQSKTLKTEIDNQSVATVKAAEDFRSRLRLLADGPLLPGQPEASFLNRLRSIQDELHELVVAAKRWNYDDASAEVIDWMNRRALGASGIFGSFDRLREIGHTRYTHEVPPGYEDRDKLLNRYGDLLFWQDVVADARRRKAAKVIVLTRDRKEDWYASAPEPEVGPALRRLRSRWEPVPSPHPMLTFEMKTQSGCELILLDDLYLGAILWRADRVRYGRFAAIAVGMDAQKLSQELAPPPPVHVRAMARQAEDRISAREALNLVRSALDEAPDQKIGDILTALEGDAPVAEAAVERLTPDWIGVQVGGQLACFCRRIYAMASPAQPFATQAAQRLLEGIDQVDAAHASAVVGGMLTSAFYDNDTQHHRPGGALLQETYAWSIDPGCERVLRALTGRLNSVQAAALVLPDNVTTPLSVRLNTSDSVATMPPALGQLFVGAQGVLTDQALGDETRLRTLLAERTEATVGEIVEAVGRYYGVPLAVLRVVDTADDETRTILETTGLERFGPLRQPTRGNVSMPANVQNAEQMPVPSDNEADQDELDDEDDLSDAEEEE